MKFNNQEQLEIYLAEREKMEQEILARLKALEVKIAETEKKLQSPKGLGWFAKSTND